jgi:hypothetical protein
MSWLRGVVASDERDASRAIGGLLLGMVAVVILYRRANVWDPLPIFLILLAPAAFLYAIGVAGGRARGAPTGSQTVFATFGTLLIPLALFAFVDLIEGDTDSSLNTAWIFALTAVFAFVAAAVAGVRAGCLIGGFALVIAWLALWNELLDEGVGDNIGTLRALLIVAAVIVLAVAAAFGMRGRPEGGARDLVTVAGLTAILAGAVMVSFAFSPVPVDALSDPDALGTGTFWEIELLAVSLALVAGGAFARARGPIYAGILGLLAFTYLVGVDFGAFEPEESLAGWPLVLVIGALVLLVWSALPPLRRSPD